MVEKFHENHHHLASTKSDLLGYGINIQWKELEVPECDPKEKDCSELPTVIIEPIDPKDYDCRYKERVDCQGNILDFMSHEKRMACRKPIDAQCFEETYESFWVLDFWSVMSWIPAIALCVFENDFDYDVCVANSAYVLNLKYLTNEMGIHF